MKPADITLAVIAKAPVPGRVKTRLCPPCSHDQAAAIAEAALRDTLDAVVAADAGRRVVVLEGARPIWIGTQFEVVSQRGDGLDERLAAAFDDVAGPTVIIGMDTPQVTGALLDQVVLALCAPDVDAVIGPSNDGGYWVIGLHHPDPAVFIGVPMSVAHTHTEQLKRLDQLGRSPATAPRLTDVDTFDQAVEVARSGSGLRFRRCVEAVLAALPPGMDGFPDDLG